MTELGESRPATILIADDDRSIRTVLHQAMARLGHDVRTTSNAATLWRWVSDGRGDLLITDVVFPDGDALDLLPRIKQVRPALPVIVMSARNTLLTAIKATERGAFEYLPKPFDLDELAAAVQRGLVGPSGDRAALAADDEAEQFEQGERLPLIGRSPAMQVIYRTLARLVGTDLTVMISGESGTGKELVARALHDYGRRRAAPFVAINMAAIPRELIESELFGHEKGAFTGATARRPGRFEQAEGGTLFLDEVGDMPLEAQTRLLRVLQEGEYTSVGGRDPIRAEVRIIAATHRNLRQRVAQGLFREDLFYRLNVVPMRLPPLRERKDDIALLVRAFLSRAAQEGFAHKSLTAAAMARLGAYHWPGNVRELENLVRRLVALHADDMIAVEAIDAELAEAETTVSAPSHGAAADGPADDNLGLTVERHLCEYFAAHDGSLPPAGLYGRVLREVERPLLTVALAATRGNQVQAARMLGLNRNTLRKKLRELNIRVGREVGRNHGGANGRDEH